MELSATCTTGQQRPAWWHQGVLVNTQIMANLTVGHPLRTKYVWPHLCALPSLVHLSQDKMLLIAIEGFYQTITRLRPALRHRPDTTSTTTLFPMSPKQKNIWVAAGDGDPQRVQVSQHLLWCLANSDTTSPGTGRARMHVFTGFHTLILTGIVTAISPNAPDPFTYTPMHAAASYSQIQVLSYLVSRGGHSLLEP